MKERTQKVIVSNLNYSQIGTTKNGVPQGSILGPILFSMYTFDIAYSIKFCHIHLYADDVQLYRACPILEIQNTINLINLDLTSFIQWCSDNGLKVNSNKTTALCIGNDHQRNLICQENIVVNDNAIIWVESAKNLGLFLDQTLRFQDHVNHVVKLSYYKLKSIYHLKFQLKEETKLLLVKSLVFPHTDYCSSVYYYFLTNYNQQKLQKIQNACMRFVCCIPYRHHVSPHLDRLCEFNVATRVKYQYIMFLYKLIMYESPQYLFNLLSRRSDSHQVNIRCNSFSTPQHHTSKFEGSFSYKAPQLLNEVQSELNQPLTSFRNKIKIKLT